MEVVIVGYSGHGLVVAEAAIESNLNLKHYSEIKARPINPFILNYLGFDGDESFKGWTGNYNFLLGIGDNKIRENTAKLILSKNKEILNVIHPSASISTWIKLGRGNFISRNVCINPLVEIGNFCILNTGSIIEHECVIADSVHIAPGAVLLGNVCVDKYSFIGANSVIKQGIKIGKNTVIGAGSVILKNVPDNEVWGGNPAKLLNIK